ncbi:MAG: alpha/beta hydrolase fold domain-containing protein [Pyrinomonadaceae bacterium]
MGVFALGCSVAAFCTELWVVIPAPFYQLWLVAVVASEWSLHIGLIGLGGALMGTLAARQGGRKARGRVSLLCGTLAFAISLYPPFSMWQIAAAHGVKLSPLRNLLASASPAPRAAQTFEFAYVDGRALRLDAYLPDAPTASDARALATASRPAVVVVHGGSWRSGDRSDFPQWNAWLAGQGYVVFDIDYRLAPQPNWQTATEDVRRAVVWVKEHAAQFGVDASAIALLGRSAGGHLALLAAYTATAPEMNMDGGNDARVRAVVALYAPTDLDWAYDHPANQRVIDGPETLRRFTGGTPDSVPEVYRQASPVTYARQDSPPTLLIHGGRDQLVRDEHMSFMMRSLLAPENAASQTHDASGRQHQAILIPYAQHGFDYNFNGWGAQLMQQVLLDFLHTQLGVAGARQK